MTETLDVICHGNHLKSHP